MAEAYLLYEEVRRRLVPLHLVHDLAPALLRDGALVHLLDDALAHALLGLLRLL